jgi:hypothetical protein
MSGHSPDTAPTPAAGGRRRGLALVAASALLVAGLSACGADSGDDDATASDPTASTSESSAPGSDSASGTASATDSPSDSGDPVSSPVIDKAVKGAIDDGFPALVPAGVPAGWTVDSATYKERLGGLWSIELRDGSGQPVHLLQAKATVKELVQQWLASAQATGEVDLGENGTGRWSVYSGDAGTAIAKKLPSTAAIVTGVDQDTVVELAGQLLTAEDATMSGAG